VETPLLAVVRTARAIAGTVTGTVAGTVAGTLARTVGLALADVLVHGTAAAPRVFVAYAHDSEGHRAAVLDLCELLVGCGVDVRVDRWAVGQRRDWHLWATTEILAADFVVVVASPLCRDAGNGTLRGDRHRGIQSELRLLRELQHDDPETWTRKVLPVLLPGRAVRDIPVFLQPWTADHFPVTALTADGAGELLRVVLDRPALPAERLAQGLGSTS
jgi:hypothetical protein